MILGDTAYSQHSRKLSSAKSLWAPLQPVPNTRSRGKTANSAHIFTTCSVYLFRTCFSLATPYLAYGADSQPWAHASSTTTPPPTTRAHWTCVLPSTCLHASDTTWHLSTPSGSTLNSEIANKRHKNGGGGTKWTAERTLAHSIGVETRRQNNLFDLHWDTPSFAYVKTLSSTDFRVTNKLTAY